LLPEYTCFSPNGTHILDKYNNSAAIWDIERDKEQFRIKGENFVFIQYGCWYGSITSINEDRSLILVKLCDVENSAPKSSTLFEVMDVGITQFSSNRQFLTAGRKSEDAIEL